MWRLLAPIASGKSLDGLCEVAGKEGWPPNLTFKLTGWRGFIAPVRVECRVSPAMGDERCAPMRVMRATPAHERRKADARQAPLPEAA